MNVCLNKIKISVYKQLKKTSLTMNFNGEHLLGASLPNLIQGKNAYLVKLVSEMSVKDKRKVFAILRKARPLTDLNYIFPQFHGITLGEFCTAHVLQTDNKRKTKTSKSSEPDQENY